MNTTAKGTRWRKRAQDFLEDMGFTTRARPWLEAGDDIVATRGSLELSVEAKDHRTITLASFVDQAERNAQPGQVPLVVVHRRGKAGVDDAYVVLSGRAFRQLLEEGPR